MGVVYNTTKQYEPITIPPEASASERRAWQRLMDILDDIYLRYGRLSIKDLAKTTVTEINKAGVFDSAQIKDLQATLARFATAEIGSATIDNAQIGTLSTQLVNALVADLERANIDTATIAIAQVEALSAITAKMEECVAGTITATEMYAQIVEATQAIVENLTAEVVVTENFTSALANISYAQIATLSAEQANIDMLNVKNSFTDESIIRNGVAGEFYMDDLVVNDANIVNLSAGDLMVKGEDGNWYRITVGEDGVEATRAPVVVENQNVDDNSLSGEKIVEGSMNVGKLSAASLQANEAFLVSLVAGLAKFGSLTANEAMVAELTAALIRANDALRIVIEQGPAALEGLNTYFDFTDGLRISAEGSNFSSKWDTQQLGFYQSGKLVAYISNNTFNADRIRANISSEVGNWQWTAEDSNNMTLKWTGAS